MSKPLRIVVCGPESTGKTELATELAGYYNCSWIPEYARTYIGTLNRPYSLEDVYHIAGVQLEQTKQAASGMLIYDTWLIITKVWLDLVFGIKDEKIEKLIMSRPVDFFLLCEPDIPWYPDPVRENGGEARQQLFLRYREEIERAGYPFSLVSGTGQERLASAVAGIDNYIKTIEK